MSSEVITGNDLKAILNEVLPPTASEYKKLLWTNSNPTTAFAAQTISLDLSDYDIIEMKYQRTISEQSTLTIIIHLGERGVAYYINGTVIGDRRVDVSTTGISILDCYSNNTVNNEFLIPLKIYGIKYERVAPPLTDMEWKEAGRTTSTSDWIDLPVTAKEVNLIAVVGGTIYSGYRSLAEPITSVTTWMFGGYYAGTSDFGYANVNMKNNGRSFQKRHFFYAGTSYDSAATLIVYYR